MIKQGDTIINVRTGQRMTFLKTWLETNGTHLQIAHEFWNNGTENAVYIQDFFPALKIDQLFETFFALARDGKLDKKGKPNIFQAAIIMLHFQNELHLAKPKWLLQKMFFRLLTPIGKLLGYLPTYE